MKVGDTVLVLPSEPAFAGELVEIVEINPLWVHEKEGEYCKIHRNNGNYNLIYLSDIISLGNTSDFIDIEI